MKKVALAALLIISLFGCANMDGSYNNSSDSNDQVNNPLTSSRAASS